MANHVDNHLTISGNHAAVAEFQRIFSNMFNNDGLQCATFLPEWDGEDYPSRDWMAENVGPKWAYVEHFEEEDVGVTITSAWCSIFPFTQRLAAHLMEFDPKVRLELTYIDEFVNFAGCAVWANNDWDVEEEDHNYFEQEWKNNGGIDFEDEEYDAWEYRDMVSEKISYWANEMGDWMENMVDE